MRFVVVAKFPCKPGQVEAMGELFKAALGHNGTTRVDMGVMAATKAQTKAANQWLEQRKALMNGTPEQAA